MIRQLIPAIVSIVGLLSYGQAAEPELELKKGDHVAIIGSAQADRMQHDGWLEALIDRTYPDYDLVFRNLAHPCDEVVPKLDTDTGGSRTDWLARTQADVILAFYGFNESFAGPTGVQRFKDDLDRFIKDTLKANYSGKGAPRLVLFSPIAQEKMADPNLTDPTINNQNIAAYTAAMAEVAKANGVPFVDLFAASQKLYAESSQPLTFNGIHLTEYGDKQFAPVIYSALFGTSAPRLSTSIEKLRAAIVDRNETWHSRYRTVDSFNIFGGRSTLSYQSGPGGPQITNAEVMHVEMSDRDVMTANRDQRIWAVAKGGDLVVNDDNLPPVPPVKTNFPGSNPDGSHPFLSGEEAIKHMHVAKGCTVTLYASEEQFPELVKPVQMAWDTKGRLWVSAWTNYPERTPTSKDGDKILIFEDTKGVGKADKCTTFISDLNCPTGFQFYKDGIVVMESPDLWYVRDSRGGDKADTRERVLMGIDAADSHHETNSMVLDQGGAMYLSDGVFMRTQVETAAGPIRNSDACIYRYEPVSQKFERYVAYGFANPHGKVFDYWGNDIITDGTGNENFFGPAFSGHIDYPDKHSGMQQFWRRPSRPCPGTGILSSRQFPEEFQNNFLNCNVIGDQGIFRVKVSEDGSGLKGETLENLVMSDDPNFRPTSVSVGPDGAIYFLDWANAIIGHMQHHLRDPNRDHVHGRIYRLTYTGRPLLTPAKIDGQPVAALLELFKEPEDNVRARAQLELAKHDAKEVIPAVDAWAAALDPKDPNYQHNLMYALWTHQWDNVVDIPLLKRLLRSPDYHARAAATRVLCYWRDRVPEAIALLKIQADDEQPRVRLEAIRACSFFRQWEAADAALVAMKHPTDYYIQYCLKETMRQLTPWWREAISQGKPLGSDNPQGIAYIMANVSTGDLARLPQGEAVWQAMFARSDATPAMREGALLAMAKQRGITPLATLLQLISSLSATSDPAVMEASRLMLLQPVADITANRAELVKLTGSSIPVQVRQASLAALMLADGTPDTCWANALTSPAALTDLLEALVLIPDPKIRDTAGSRVLTLLDALPATITAQLATMKGTATRYVRVQLPHRGTLTLAEVQVFSDGTNIATCGTASQSSTAYDGVASRAIDGRTSGNYGDGSCTHTTENDDAPWWEVDLGSEHMIDAVKVWNRTDGDLGQRLNGFQVILLDGERHEVTRSQPEPAPQESVNVALPRAGDPASTLRRAAIRAALATCSDPKPVFLALARLIVHGDQVGPCARAIKQIPRASWATDQLGAVVDGLVSWVKTIPLEGRTTPEVVEVIALARSIAEALDPAAAAAAQAAIANINVRTITLTTVREQMRYDQKVLVVEAGKPLEIVLKNVDAMPHNFVIVTPGSRNRIGQLAMTLPPTPDKDGFTYIPKDPAVLAATKLVDPGQKYALHWTAPAEPGEYEYLCTFPGHYLIMCGKLVVTKDVAGYLKAHGQAGGGPAAGF